MRDEISCAHLLVRLKNDDLIERFMRSLLGCSRKAALIVPVLTVFTTSVAWEKLEATLMKAFEKDILI